MADNESYVHMVFFLVPEEKLRAAESLAQELHKHGNALRGMRAISDLRILRSLVPKGAVQFIVEATWVDSDLLADYEESEATIEALVRESGLVQPQSLQVYDMLVVE